MILAPHVSPKQPFFQKNKIMWRNIILRNDAKSVKCHNNMQISPKYRHKVEYEILKKETIEESFI